MTRLVGMGQALDNRWSLDRKCIGGKVALGAQGINGSWCELMWSVIWCDNYAGMVDWVPRGGQSASDNHSNGLYIYIYIYICVCVCVCVWVCVFCVFVCVCVINKQRKRQTDRQTRRHYKEYNYEKLSEKNAVNRFVNFMIKY